MLCCFEYLLISAYYLKEFYFFSFYNPKIKQIKNKIFFHTLAYFDRNPLSKVIFKLNKIFFVKVEIYKKKT